MLDINTRNKQVKKVLSGIFGKENVSVRGGRGTAHGWVDVEINGGKRLSNEEFYNQAERDLMNSINHKAKEAIKHIELGSYTDDMNFEHDECIIQVRLT